MPGPSSALALGGDFLRGFQDESTGMRQEADRKQSEKDARDAKVFETLANSDDPEIRAAAVTGLLTGNHPAKGMDKWFGKVQANPIHDTIRGLIGAGHQPFMDPAKRHATELGNDIDARIASITKSSLSPENKTRATLGVYGAPPPRPLPLQPGTLHMKDGTTVPGFFDPTEGVYYDKDYQPADAVRFEKSGAGGNTAPENSALEPDSNSKTGYSKVYRDKAGKEVYRVEAPEPGAAGGSFTGIPNANSPSGISSFNRKAGTVRNAPIVGAPSGITPPPVVAPAPATADIGSLREIESSILRLHPQPKPMFAGGSIAPAKEQAWRQSLDQEAQHYGYQTYGALQQAIADAQQGVGARSLSGPPPLPPGAEGGAGEGAGGKAKANTGTGKIDVQSILNELAAGRKHAGAPAR